MKTIISACIASALMCASALAQSTPTTIPVTPDAFVRAETDLYFAMFNKQGGFGKFSHFRDLPLENTGVRETRGSLMLVCR